MAEQRYQPVLAVIAEGRTVTEVAAQWRVSRQTLHTLLARYEGGGLEGLADRSHRPERCPHQMEPEVEAMVLELRRSRPYWGPRKLVVQLARRGVLPLPSRSAVYRCLVRAGSSTRRLDVRVVRLEAAVRWNSGRSTYSVAQAG